MTKLPSRIPITSNLPIHSRFSLSHKSCAAATHRGELRRRRMSGHTGSWRKAMAAAGGRGGSGSVPAPVRGERERPWRRRTEGTSGRAGSWRTVAAATEGLGGSGSTSAQPRGGIEWRQRRRGTEGVNPWRRRLVMGGRRCPSSIWTRRTMCGGDAPSSFEEDGDTVFSSLFRTRRKTAQTCE